MARKKNRKNNPGKDRRKRMIGNAIIACCLLLLFGAAGWQGVPRVWQYLSSWDLFTLHSVAFTQLENIEEEPLRSLLPDLTDVNLFTLDVNALEAAILQHPWVEAVSIERCLPNKLVFAITEKTPIALLHVGKLWALDPSGTVLPLDGWHGSMDLPLVRYKDQNKLVPGEMVKSTAVTGALHQLNGTRNQLPELWQIISEICWDRNGQLVFYTAGSKTTILFGETPGWEQMLNLYSFLIYEGGLSGLDDIDQIDLRFRGQVVVRRNGRTT